MDSLHTIIGPETTKLFSQHIWMLGSNALKMNRVHFEGETSFYNIFNSEYNIRCDQMILRLGLVGIYIGDKGYNYNETVP
jgi:hypothetical protein